MTPFSQLRRLGVTVSADRRQGSGQHRAECRMCYWLLYAQSAQQITDLAQDHASDPDHIRRLVEESKVKALLDQIGQALA